MNATISQNNLSLLADNKLVNKNLENKMQVLKKDCNLFARLYIACQKRQGNSTDFFAHENNSFPPALSNNVTLGKGNKADTLICLNSLTSIQFDTAPTVSASVLDSAVIVHMLKPNVGTFSLYSERTFIPYDEAKLRKIDRLDIIWDTYIVGSLKAEERLKRGSGVRRKVVAQVTIPKYWAEFLRVDENKKALFVCLANEIIDYFKESEKCIAVTQKNIVLALNHHDILRLSPCTHEEADTRIILHTADMARAGHKSILIRTVDSDVVVIATAHFHTIKMNGLEQLWVAFSIVKSFRYLPIHFYANALGNEKAKALLFFHTFTGCDTTSSLAGCGKNTVWDTWNVYSIVRHFH